MQATMPCSVLAALVLAGCDSEGEVPGRPQSQSPSAVVTVTDADFAREVLESSKPVLVDFWAAWCRPCLEMKPAVEAVAAEYAGRATVVQVDVDANAFTAEKYDVRSLPTLLLFRGGRLVERIDGPQSREDLARALDRVVAPAGRR